MKGNKLRQLPQGGLASVRDEWSSEGFERESFSDSFGLPNKERLALKYSSLMDIMEERMKREECILSTSPHKKVVNAIRYAKAVNSTLESNLEKTLDMLHREFEQEFLRIVDVERKVCEEYPTLGRYAQTVLTGATNRQFQRRLSKMMATRKRTEEFEQTRVRFSLPRLSSDETSRRKKLFFFSHPHPTKKHSDIVYLPPI